MIKVSCFPLQSHCFAFGGFELQMISAIESVNNIYIYKCIVSRNNPWSQDKSFDIAHFWGLEISNYNNINWAKKSSKKVVLSVLTPYTEFKYMVRGKFSKILYQGRIIKKMLGLVDAITVVNEGQKKYLKLVYNIPENKIFVIPNIVSNNFFENKASCLSKIPFPNESYIICVGNICRRKNQLLLANACKVNNTNLVFVGSTLEGEEKYAEEISVLINKNSNILWIPKLETGSDELVSIMSNADAFVLLSEYEQQPISALEAVALNLPILLSNKLYAKERYYESALLADSNSIDSIINGINLLLKNKNNYKPNSNIIIECMAENVAKKYYDVYKSLCS